MKETKRTNIGRIIIFCEGKTEKNYFEYFAEIINKNKFTDVQVETETANGNAQTVFNFADNFMAIEMNNMVYNQYGKYIVFDCDAPSNIQSIINNIAQCGIKYNLLISNFLFETWLLMHFEDVEKKLSKREIYKRLTYHLGIDKSYSSYKGNKGIIRKIIQIGNVEMALYNAKLLAERYTTQGQSIFTDIKDMNPYTSVHELVEQLMLEISQA